MSRNKKHSASVAAAVSVSFFAFSGGALAAPSGGSVVRGDATIDQNDLQTLITQTTGKAVINWDDFSIDPTEVVKFIQNNSSSVTLNRVTGSNISQIKGALTANGNIFLINPNGIVFGDTAQVDVAGLLASTFDIDDQDFMGGNFNFTGDMMSSASIKNDGELKVGDGGFVYLIAPNVENTGHIVANVGRVTLGSDGIYSIDLAGNGLIKFEVSNATLSDATSSVSNSGDITADHVLLSGSQADSVVSSVVNAGNIKAATSLTLSGSSVDNHAGTLELDVKSGDSHDQIVLQSDSSAGTVDFQNNSLSTSGNVDGTIKVTNSTGGVTLNKAEVSGDLSVSAAGNIIGADNSGGDARANHLSLYTTVEGASIGTEGSALRFDADTLSASADKGHIVVSDTSGDLALVRITTNDNSAEAGLRAIITAEDGNLTGVDTDGANVEAWATNLQADGNIGGTSQAVTTSVQVLSAATQDGGIHIDNSGDDLVLNTVSASERITQQGQTVSSTAVSNADGEVTLSNGVAGSHDVSIRSDQDILISNNITATGDLTIESRDGSLYQAGDSALLTGLDIDLGAGGGIGQSGGGALKTQSNRINARADNGGVYLQEGVGLNVGEISAGGHDNNIELTVTQGDASLHHIRAEGGSVSVTAAQGIIKRDGSTSNVEADSLTLNAKKNIGTSGSYLATKVDDLTTISGTNLAGTYVANQGPLARLDVTTLDGDVSIRDSQSGETLTFTGSNDQLGLSGTVQTDELDFTNGAGGLNVNGMDLSGQDVAFTASGAINGQNGVLKASQATLFAEDGIDMDTDVDRLDASTSHGDIDINNSAHTGTLTATASADDGDITLTQGGDLAVGGITASGDVSLTAGGAITGVAEGTDVEAANLALSGNGIGTSGDAFVTAVDDRLSANAGIGGLFLANVGSLTLLNGEADGDIDLSVTGNAILDTLKSGGDVVFSASGRVSDGNGDSNNIEAGTLTMDAQQIGARNSNGTVDALEMKVDQLVLDTSNGGIFVRNLKDTSLTLTHAKAAGGDLSIATAGDMELNSVTAAGNKVTLTSGGAINDGRPKNSTDANVLAKELEMQAQSGVGNDGAISLDVDHLSVGGGNGSVNAANLGAVAVDSSSLAGKGTAGVTIVATSITILDDNGGVIILDGGSLTLTATNGNVVFLNQDDTIVLPGGGSITLTAKADPEHQGYNGNIITGNLKTTGGGDITLDADTNVTLGMLDTGGEGDVSVTAHNGVILDGNGADQNIRGDHVTLTANTPSLNDAEINRETAIADYAARLAELNADTLQLENLQQQLASHIAALKAAIVAKGIAQTQQNSQQRELNSLQLELAILQAIDDSLNVALNVAGVARNAIAIAAGAAQAVPFSGDAGADAAFAVVDLAFSVAQTALDTFERVKLNPLAGDVSDAQIYLATLKANTQNAITSVETYTNLRDTTQVSVNNTTQAVFNAQVAADASEALRKQAISAYNQNQDIGMSADNPLGIEANRLDMGTSSGRALNSDVYLTSDGSLGLGDIASSGVIRVENVANDISVVGDVVSPLLISLQAEDGVRGIGGTWVNGVLTPEVGTLHAPAIAVRAGAGIASSDDTLHTDTDEVAAEGGDGNLFIANNNGGDELVLGTVDGISGLKADGDLGLFNQGDLRLKTQIVDTDTSSDNTAHLGADDGDIIDDNGSTLNVTAHQLNFQAQGNVELDTDVDLLAYGASLGEGDITLRNRGDLDIRQLSTNDGDLNVDTTGGMLLEALSAGGEDGDIILNADGNIDDDQDNTTRISGRTLAMTAAGSIGANGDNEHRALDTSVDSVTASANGEVNLDDSDDLDVTRVATSTGDVTLTNQSGDLHLGKVRTDGDGNTITAQAAGAIDALNAADDTAELHASNLALRAGDSIGSDNQALLVEASALEAVSGNGGLFITARNNDLTIGGVTPNLGLPAFSGLDASGDLRLEVTDGSVTVNEAVTQTGDGDASLYSSGDMTVIAGMQANGDLQMQSGESITVNGQTLTADGNLIGVAGGDVTLASNSVLHAGHGLGLAAEGAITVTDGTLNSGTAADLGEEDIDDLLLLTQSGDITLTNTTGTAAGGVQVGAGAGFPDIQPMGVAPSVPSVAHVTLTDSTLNAQGDDLVFSATGDVTLTQASHATAADNLSAQAGGDITVEQGSALTSTAGEIDADAGKRIAVTDSAAQAGTSASFDAKQAHIRIDNGSLIAGTDLSLEAGTDIALTDTSGDGDNVGSTVTAQNGDLSLTAGNRIALDSASHGTGHGDVTANAETGDLTVIEQSSLTAQMGQMDLDAGHRIAVTDSTLSAATDLNADAATDIALDNSQATAGDDLAMTAGTNVSLDHSSAEADTGELSLIGTGGDVRLSDSEAKAGNNLAAKAGGDIALADSIITGIGKTDLHAAKGVAMTGSEATAGSVMTVTADAADIRLDDSNASAVTDMTLYAGGDIALTDTSGDGDNVGSTVTAQNGDLSLTAGNRIALDSASHGTGHGDVTANTETGDLTVIEQSSLTAQMGQMDLGAGHRIAVTDSTLSAATGLSADAAANIALNNSQATAGDNLSMTAGNDVSLTDSIAEAAGSDLAITANNGDIELTRGSATAQGNVSLSAGGAVSQTDHSLAAITGTLTATADGAINQAGTSNATAAGDLELHANDGVTVTDLSSDADLTVAGGQGGIAMVASSLAEADGDVTMTTDGNINLTQVQAGGDVTLTSKEGGINASGAVSENVTGDNLFLSAVKGIGSALSGLKTQVSNLYASITGSGDLHVVEADGLGVKNAQLTKGKAHLATGDDLTIDRLVANGDVRLDSAGVIRTGKAGYVNGAGLTASAMDGIDLNADLASASLTVRGSGDIDLSNQGALMLKQATTAAGDITVSTGGDLGIGRVSAPGPHKVTFEAQGTIDAHGAGSIDASDVALTADKGIGSNGALSLNAATLSAVSDNGNIDLSQTGTVSLERVRTGKGEVSVAVAGGDATLGDIRADGDVTLSAADGRLANDGVNATYVGGDTVTLSSANGIGATGNALATQARRIDASVRGAGNINIAERDSLAGLNASATNGNVKVSTASGNLTVDHVKALSPGNAVMLYADNGSILDGNGDANNIVASLLRIAAAQGIARATDPLDVRVASLAADGGKGGVYINNGSNDPLSVIGLVGQGNVGLNTGGDLTLSGDVKGGGVSLRSGGDVLQDGNIVSDSYVNVYGYGDLTMTPDAQTVAITNVDYHAGDTLTVNDITTTGGLTGGRITLEGKTFKSNADNNGSLNGGVVQFLLTNPQGINIGELVGSVGGKSRVSLNGRTQGGKITEDSEYVADMVAPPNALPTVLSQDISTPSFLGFQPDPNNGDEWHYNP